MFRMLDPALGAPVRTGLALAATTLLLSVVVHFSADLAWLYRQATVPDTTPAAGAPLPGNSERLFLADPGSDEAWLPPAWSAPGRSALPVQRMLVPNDRALPPLPLLRPPAFPSTPVFAHL
jgi:hypothetical protein